MNPQPGETWEVRHNGKSALVVLVVTQDGYTFTGLILMVERGFEPREAIRAGIVETFTTEWFSQEGSLLSTERVPSPQ